MCFKEIAVVFHWHNIWKLKLQEFEVCTFAMQKHYIKVVQGGVFSRDCEYLAYFEPKTNIKKIKSHKRDIMQLSSADATMFKKQNEKELPMET